MSSRQREGGSPSLWIPAFAGMTPNPIIFLKNNKIDHQIRSYKWNIVD